MGLPNPMSKRRAFVAILSTTAMILGLFALTAPTAAIADTAPPVPTDPATVSTDALATPQINGVVWSQVVVGNVDYVAGNFTSARPYGSAAGTNETPRSYLLSYDVTTGALLSWAPTVNAQVRALSVSPDHTRLYAVGDFTTVNGVTRNRIASFDLPSGALDTAFHPSSNNSIYAVTSTNSTVYFGGTFSAVAGLTRVGTAAASSATGTPTAWNPLLGNGRAYAMTVSPDGSKVVIGGAFTTMNGNANPGYGLGMVDAIAGASLPFGTNDLVRDGGVNSAIFSLTSDSDSIYGTGYVFGAGGNLEGTFRADWSGNLQWVEDCHGDEYSVAVQDQTIYIAGHPHYCGNIGGFPQTMPDWTFHRALAFSKATTGTITHDPNGYYDFAGTPSPTQLNWFPDMNLGSFTGQYQGPWSVASSPNYVVYGGEFTQVNGKAQQGLVRFATKAVAPNLDGPRLSGANLVPTLQSQGAGEMTVSWPADWDRDNESLTYQVYLDGKTATAAYTTKVNSRFWNQPTISWVDTGLTPGVHTWRVRATDPFGNTAWGTTTSGTVSASGVLSAYAQSVISDQPTDYWRLNDASGSTTANDAVGRYNGTAGSGVTFQQPGAIIGDNDTAASFDGTGNGLVASSGQVWSTDTFTIETWIKTTSSSGGKIVGFGNSNTGTSSNYDRHVYMNAHGNLLFGVYPGSSQVIQSSKTYNDGQWHQVAATLSAKGMFLFVDGAKVASNASVTTGQNYWGYWRVGGDSSWSGNPFIQGSIDDTAIYPTALPQAEIDNHYALSGRSITVPVAPSDAYGASVFGADPLLYYRLNESAGTVAKDSGAQGNPGVYSGSYTQGVAGGINGTANTATAFTNGTVASGASYDNPSTYSTQIWFNTTSTTGGKLTGFGDSQTGNSGSYDRHVYMQNNGQLVFGTWTGQTNTITTPQSYNDGKWHQVTATQSSAGMNLYVDGQLVGFNPQTSAQAYTGYWKAGNDVTWGSDTNNFTGTLQDFAVYDTALSSQTVAAQYALGAPAAPNQLPTAAFTPSITGQALSVDASASNDPDGTIASYAWDFGDGSTQAASPAATATHNYAAPGDYNVTLTVTDNSNGVATATHTVTAVHVNQPPVAVFTSTPTNLQVAFDAGASSDPDGTIASYSWDFGDGTTGTGPTATHTYANGGTYAVALTVKDNIGATSTANQSVTVSPANIAPTASFTVASTAGSLTVGVNASASSDPDGAIVSYDINYGDGSADGTSANTTHTYAHAGTYNIGVTVTDNGGASGVLSQPVTVTKANVAPTASFTATVSNLAVAFDASASSDDGTITGYAWDFGDGSTGTGATASHTYAAAGNYTVTLTVTDDGNLTGTASHVVAPAATSSTIAKDLFERTTPSGWASALTGGTWTLSSAANASVGSGVGVLSHTAGATRTALLKSTSVTDADISTDVIVTKALTGGGAFAGIVARNTATDYYQSRIRFLTGGTLAVQILQGGSTVLANATVPGTYTPGTSLTIETQISGTSPTTIKAKVWPTGGTVPTTWAVTTTSSAAGLQTAGSVGIVSYASASITNAPLPIDFDNYVATSGGGTPPPANVAPTASFHSSVNNLAVAFDGSASKDSDGTIASYAWNFGDGATGTGATPSHTYAAAGNYTVTLTVTDNGGLTGTASATVTTTTVVTPPPNVIATDNFGRTTANGWGTATVGGAWAGTASANYSVSGGAGAVIHAAGSTRRALLSTISAKDVELQAQVSSDKAVSAGQIVMGLVARQVGTDFYQARVRLLPGGGVGLQIVHGSSTVLADTTIAGLTYTPGDKINLRVRFTGSSPTTIQAMLWPTTATQPTAWQLTATDSTAALQVAAPIGFESYISTSASNAPVTVRYYNYSAVIPQ